MPARKRTTKRTTPQDVADSLNPMQFIDPLYVITCRERHVAYGYPFHEEPRFYGKPGWPKEYLLPPVERFKPEGYMTNPWPEPPEVEHEPWVPWSERDEEDWDPDTDQVDPEIAAEIGRWLDDGGIPTPNAMGPDMPTLLVDNPPGAPLGIRTIEPGEEV